MFNLRAGNGQVILTSERYTTKAAALNGIESVRTNAPVDDRYEWRVAKVWMAAGRPPWEG